MLLPAGPAHTALTPDWSCESSSPLSLGSILHFVDQSSVSEIRLYHKGQHPKMKKVVRFKCEEIIKFNSNQVKCIWMWFKHQFRYLVTQNTDHCGSCRSNMWWYGIWKVRRRVKDHQNVHNIHSLPMIYVLYIQDFSMCISMSVFKSLNCKYSLSLVYIIIYKERKRLLAHSLFFCKIDLTLLSNRFCCLIRFGCLQMFNCDGWCFLTFDLIKSPNWEPLGVLHEETVLY